MEIQRADYEPAAGLQDAMGFPRRAVMVEPMPAAEGGDQIMALRTAQPVFSAGATRASIAMPSVCASAAAVSIIAGAISRRR